MLSCRKTGQWVTAVCHDKYFVFKGTEDMIKEYHNYWFHIKGFFIGELLALIICSLAGVIIQFVL